jgi:release factor glutamine methyltransferase
MTVREVLVHGTALLNTAKVAEITSPALDAGLLLAKVLHTNRAGLIMRGLEPVSDAVWHDYTTILERRLAGECVAWIVGYKEFRGLNFTVNPDVLVPRPDTETLVEAALHYIDASSFPEKSRVLDMCTGSGAVAIALKHERPCIEVWAADISKAALQVAQDNAETLLGGTVHCIESDLFDRIEGRFNIITANPPYVSSDTINRLALEVRLEPRVALDGGADGLDLIRCLISEAKNHLYPEGMLLIEAAPEQMREITALLLLHGYKNIQTYEDLSGAERVIVGTLREELVKE